MSMSDSLEETCFKYVLRHLGNFPCDMLQRLPNVMRYKMLLCLPATVIWRMETTPFVQGLDMETVWKQLCSDRLALHSGQRNEVWSCSKGTQGCLNSTHDRGTMASLGVPLVFHDCVVTGLNHVGSATINCHHLSSRSLYFLFIWKSLCSEKAFNENHHFLTKMLFHSVSPLETIYSSPILPSSSHCILFNILNVPLELVSVHQQSMSCTSTSPSSNYDTYVNTLMSFLALECHARPTFLYINMSHSFLIEQSANVLLELLRDIVMLSLEYSPYYRALLEAALHNPDKDLVLAIRGHGAAADLIQIARLHKKLHLQFSFSGRNKSEPELTGLITALGQCMTSLDICLPESSHKLGALCLSLVKSFHITRLSLDGVLCAAHAVLLVTSFLATPCSAHQSLYLKRILISTTKDKIQLEPEPAVCTDLKQRNDDYWKLKSLFISSENNEFSSWVLSLSCYKIFSLEIVDYTANFNIAMFNLPIQVQKFNLSITAAHTTIDSLVLSKIMMTVASPALQCMCLDLNCKTSLGPSSIIRSLTAFLNNLIHVGMLLQFQVRIHENNEIDSSDLFIFFTTLFNLPYISGLNFKLDCRNCDCNHSLVLDAWQQGGKSIPAQFYFRTSSIEWKMLPTPLNIPQTVTIVTAINN